MLECQRSLWVDKDTKAVSSWFQMENNTINFYKDLKQSYDEKNDIVYILEVDVDYSKELQKGHSYLRFLPEKINIGKCQKLTCNLHDKKKHAVHIKSLKQVLGHRLIIEIVHMIIMFNQEAWLKPFTD